MPNQTVREQKTEPRSASRSKTSLIVLGTVLLLLFGGVYLYLCTMVHPNQVLSKTRVVYPASFGDTEDSAQALELSGMDREGVVNALEQDYPSHLAHRTITVRAFDADYEIPLENTLTMDVQTTADQALAPSQAPFLLRGMSELRSLVTWRDLKAEPVVEDEALLREEIRGSGLLDKDTSVATTYERQDDKLLFHKGRRGESVDEDALVQQLNDSLHSGAFDTVLNSPMREGQDTLDWSAVEQDICQTPQNATLKLDEDRRDYEILDSVSGISFDRTQAQKALDTAPEESDVSVDLTVTEPELSAKQLKTQLFKDKLGTYTTIVSGTADRISNVRLAAEKCDGIILCKGDGFSYNDTLGERTVANGFKKAGAYLNGTTVQELGGGICQVSSTLYAAVLDANLKIVERHNHTFASSYIGLGMDATVSWGGPDFKFQNDKEYPIRLETVYRDGEAIVNIWGTRTDNRTVKMVSETLETIPYPTVKKKSTKLKKGKTSVSEKGSDGYRVQTYREVYEDGTLLSSEKEAYSVYSPHKQVVVVGAKGKKKHSKGKKNKKSKSSKSKSSRKNKHKSKKH